MVIESKKISGKKFKSLNAAVLKNDDRLDVCEIYGRNYLANFQIEDMVLDYDMEQHYRPYLTLIGNVRNIVGDFSNNVNEVYFGEDDKIDVSCIYDFTDDEIKDLIDKGIYNDTFKTPDDLVGQVMEIPVSCNVLSIQNTEIPITFVEIDDPHRVYLTTESTGYKLSNYFVNQGMTNSKTISKQISEEKIVNRYSKDNAKFFENTMENENKEYKNNETEYSEDYDLIDDKSYAEKDFENFEDSLDLSDDLIVEDNSNDLIVDSEGLSVSDDGIDIDDGLDTDLDLLSDYLTEKEENSNNLEFLSSENEEDHLSVEDDNEEYYLSIEDDDLKVDDDVELLANQIDSLEEDEFSLEFSDDEILKSDNDNNVNNDEFLLENESDKEDENDLELLDGEDAKEFEETRDVIEADEIIGKKTSSSSYKGSLTYDQLKDLQNQTFESEVEDDDFEL